MKAGLVVQARSLAQAGRASKQSSQSHVFAGWSQSLPCWHGLAFLAPRLPRDCAAARRSSLRQRFASTSWLGRKVPTARAMWQAGSPSAAPHTEGAVGVSIDAQIDDPDFKFFKRFCRCFFYGGSLGLMLVVVALRGWHLVLQDDGVGLERDCGSKNVRRPVSAVPPLKF